MQLFRPSPLDTAIGEAELAQDALVRDAVEPTLPAVRKRGRPKGSRNRRHEADAAALLARHDDPLDVATEIAARQITRAGELARLAQELGMDHVAAAEFWLRTLIAVLPYLHQRMPQKVILNPGAPGGERVLLDVTPDREVDG